MSAPPPPPPDEHILDYAERPARISRLAVAAALASIASIALFFLVVPGFIALPLALVAGHRIKKRPRTLGGKGYADFAFTNSLCAICLSLLIAVFLPSWGSHRMANRSQCSANLRSLVQSMIVYASANAGDYPVVTYASYSPALNSPTAAGAETTGPASLVDYYKVPYPQAGSVTASLWILVLSNQCTPRQFLCPTDPSISGPGLMQNASARYYNNFQGDTQISYSAAYPWKADGTVGKWWHDTTDSTLPLIADMAPEQGTGTPRRDLISTSASPKARNSANHLGDGQNVGYADAHAEFDRKPDVGQDNDNIWTSSGDPSAGPSSTGIAASRTSPHLTCDVPPFDIEMLPIRNLDTGRL